ncbi:MAG TPA: S-methyl-5'-thioadenosine phosphorylase [Candidatus Polarisedimenticolia bacterium]|nr:S-methyl-5'-thioadenosine phosphorylase [Candidatus Polarisedimenticolia bacterium]
MSAPLGVIGGSGLYSMAGLERAEEIRVDTPFGEPSDAYIRGVVGGRPIVFLARHGRGHRLLPTELNFRANIAGFKMLGVERLVSVSAVGSMKEDLHPLDVVLPDQFIDWTRHRTATFFGGGVVAHVSLADPVCAELRGVLHRSAEGTQVRLHDGGTYLCIEGPQFSTRAESHLYRSWKVDVIGMTNVQEAKLSREAEICYATVAMVTDYDCWKEDETAVTVEEIVARLHDNAKNAEAIVTGALALLPEKRSCACGSALAQAILTDRARIPAEAKKRLRPIAGARLD